MPLQAPRRISWPDYEQERGVAGLFDDQGPLSPSGHMSRRTKKALDTKAREDLGRWFTVHNEYQAAVDAGDIIDPTGGYKPRKSDLAQRADTLRGDAQRLRDLAARGMNSRAYLKKAAEWDLQVAVLEEQERTRLAIMQERATL